MFAIVSDAPGRSEISAKTAPVSIAKQFPRRAAPLNWRLLSRACLLRSMLVCEPVVVTAPRSKRVWLNPEVTCCDVHSKPLASIESSRLRRCKNFDQI